MPQDIKLDTVTHDLVFENADLVLISELDYVIQKVKIKLLFFFQEWFLDTTKGVNYFGEVFVKTPNMNVVDNMIKATIFEVEEIIELLKYTSSFEPGGRKFIINFEVNTIYGRTSFSEEVTI